MDPFGWTPEQYAALAALATVVAAASAVVTMVVLALAARYAAGQVEQAKQLRRDQTRPYVVPSIDVEQQTMFMLRVENVGKTPAHNVRVVFEEPPRSEMRDIDDLRMLNEPIPTMPPGKRFRAYWESALTVFDEKEPYPHPMSYRVSVAYEDYQGHKYGPEAYVLDFEVYRGQATGPKGMAELIKAMEQLLAEHKKWTDGTRDLHVNVRNAVRERRRDDRPWHFRQTRRAYDRGGLKGAATYWIDLWRRRYGLWVK